MYYREYTPSPLLAHLVQCYVALGHEEVNQQPAESWLLPSGFTTISTNISAVSLVVDNAKYSQFNVPQMGHASGQLTQPLKMNFSAGSHLFSLKLQPHGFFYFFGIPGSELRDDYVPLECLHRLWTPDLINQLIEAPNDHQRVDILNRHLLSRLPARPTRPDALQYAVALITNHGGLLPMVEVARRLHVSPRHLTRLFEERVGLSPKFYARTVRFANLSRRLWHAERCTPQDLVHDFGFYDQSHFIKEVRAFTGLNPTSAVQHSHWFDLFQNR